jgi:hypothetical protein
VAEAEPALEGLRQPSRYPLLEARVEPGCPPTRRGRPKSGEVGYRLSRQGQRQAQAPAYPAWGRFILATHVLEAQALGDAEGLLASKKQSEGERGVRFLKAPGVRAETVCLKTRLGRLVILPNEKT